MGGWTQRSRKLDLECLNFRTCFEQKRFCCDCRTIVRRNCKLTIDNCKLQIFRRAMTSYEVKFSIFILALEELFLLSLPTLLALGAEPAGAPERQAASQTPLLLVAARVFDPAAGKNHQGWVVLVEGEKIMW